jgi:predicted DNA-binding antitoxin AbrB/MazE fold protein
MKVITYEATVEAGQIKLLEPVHLPEHAKVYVVIPGVEARPRYDIGSPRLAHPEKVSDFIKEVIEEGQNASVR